MVVVLDLGLGQRGLLDRAPHHRPQAAIERAVHQELADLAGDHGFRREVHRRVAACPVAEHAEALELLALHAEPVLRIGAAFGAEFQDRDLVLVLLLRAVLLLDLPFDRQAVAVPAGDVVGVVAGHLRGAVDHVLQDLVQRVADVQRAVGIGRAVMQDEFRPARRTARAARSQRSDALPSAPASRARASAGRRASGSRSSAGRRCRGSRGRGRRRGASFMVRVSGRGARGRRGGSGGRCAAVPAFSRRPGR